MLLTTNSHFISQYITVSKICIKRSTQKPIVNSNLTDANRKKAQLESLKGFKSCECATPANKIYEI